MSSSGPTDESQPERSDDQRVGAGASSAPGTPAPTAAHQFAKEVESRRTEDSDDDEEVTLWEGGYSAKAMVGTWVVLALVSVAILVVSLMIPAIGLLIGLGVVLVIWVIGGIRYAVRRLGVHYELTTQRFIHQTGVVSRQTDRMEVIDIDDVTFRQGPIERAFGIGTIVLTGSDRTHATLSMIGIADVKEVAGLIDDTRRKERRRRSLHIEAI